MPPLSPAVNLEGDPVDAAAAADDGESVCDTVVGSFTVTVPEGPGTVVGSIPTVTVGFSVTVT